MNNNKKKGTWCVDHGIAHAAVVALFKHLLVSGLGYSILTYNY